MYVWMGRSRLNITNTAAQTDTALRDVVMSFVIAGRDTTSVALSWVFWELTQHPDVTARYGI